MFEGLSGKSAIVTGGATLIGAAVVRALHAAGVKVVIADFDTAGGSALATALGSGVRFVATDITQDAQLQGCVDETLAQHGGIDFIVNLACSYLDDGLNSSRADWLTAFNVNLASAVMLVKAALPQLQRNAGAVVNFSRISAGVAQTGRCLYPVSKAAMVQLTRNMAMGTATPSASRCCRSW